MKTLSPIPPPAPGDFLPTATTTVEPIPFDKNVRRKRLELQKLISGNNSNINHFSTTHRQQNSDTDDSKPSFPSPSTLENPKKACLSYGAALVMGRRREMEDAVRIERGFAEINRKKLDFFGVFDGHGGEFVAKACRDRMHQILTREIEETMVGKAKEVVEMEGGVNWEKVMAKCFEKMDREIGGDDEPKDEGEEMTIGSTAVTAVVGKEELVVANCGDSRAVLCRNGVAVPLSVDHKPDRPDELARIEAAGGRVINWNGPRVLGVLATSRSIGDNYLKPYVISKPEVTVCNRTREDEFLILASDGLWDVVSNELACQFVRKCLFSKIRAGSNDTRNGISAAAAARSRASEAAAFLANLALNKGSRDNISVIVVELKKFRRSTCK